MPYRISARERPTRDRAPLAAARALRIVGGLFAAAGAASAVALAVIGGSELRSSVGIGAWVDRGVAVVVPLVVLAMAVRAAPHTRLRRAAFATAGVWLAAFVGRVAHVVDQDSYALSVSVSVVRVFAVAGLALLPVVAGSRRVVPRWPALAAIALSAGDAWQKIGMGRDRVLPAQFDPSSTTMALCALLAYAFLVAGRELGGESIDERADRFGPIPTTLFATNAARATFLGPVRLATDALLAFAIVTLVATTTTVAYSRSFRLDAPAAGAEASALVVLFTASLSWLKRSSNEASFAPIAAAIVATIAAIFSTMLVSGAALSVALLPLGIAVIGLGVVTPRTRDADARTMRRWVTFVSAMGVMLASAGFFAIYSYGDGEPFLARFAKLGAVVFGVMAANATRRLELHARIELAAEDREP